MRSTEFISAPDCPFSGPDQQGIAKKRHQDFGKRVLSADIDVQEAFQPRKYPHATTLQGTISEKCLLLFGCMVADRRFFPIPVPRGGKDRARSARNYR
jgi:hypothetical protein